MACMGGMQAQEPAQYRVSYDCDSQPKTDNTERVNHRWVLNIGQSTAEFYCKTAQDYVTLRDSLFEMHSNKIRGKKHTEADHKEWNDIMDRVKSMNKNNLSRSLVRVQLNLSAPGKYTCTDNVAEVQLRYEEEMPVLSWDMTDETKEIEGYVCKKAKAEIYGRTWEVWYTEELPLSFGPWLLRGLPGLILEAQDTENAFHFTLAGLEQLDGSSAIAVPDLRDVMKCSRKRFLEMRLNADTNRFDAFNNGGNQMGIASMEVKKDADGEAVIEVVDINGETFNAMKTMADNRNYFDRK